MSWLRLMEESIKENPSGEEPSADPGTDDPAAVSAPASHKQDPVQQVRVGGKVSHLIKEMWPAYLIEVLVIILGISITLVLEEWRDNSKEEKIAKVYRKNLLADIDTDLQALKTVSANTSDLLAKGNELLGFIKDPAAHALPPDRLLGDIKAILGRPDFISSDATFSDLKNSGNMHLLKDLGLKNSLFAYYNLAQGIKENQDAELQATITLSGAYFLKRFPLGGEQNLQPKMSGDQNPQPVMSSAELQQLSKDFEFGNNVQLRVHTRQELSERYQRATGLGAQLKKILSEKGE